MNFIQEDIGTVFIHVLRMDEDKTPTTNLNVETRRQKIRKIGRTKETLQRRINIDCSMLNSRDKKYWIPPSTCIDGLNVKRLGFCSMYCMLPKRNYLGRKEITPPWHMTQGKLTNHEEIVCNITTLLYARPSRYVDDVNALLSISRVIKSSPYGWETINNFTSQILAARYMFLRHIVMTLVDFPCVLCTLFVCLFSKV